jgi:hypothetical protein
VDDAEARSSVLVGTRSTSFSDGIADANEMSAPLY